MPVEMNFTILYEKCIQFGHVMEQTGQLAERNPIPLCKISVVFRLKPGEEPVFDQVFNGSIGVE